MNTKMIFALALGLALFAQDRSWSQPPAQEAQAQEEDTLPMRPSKGKKAEPASASEKQVIESYVRNRISQLTKAFNAQQTFGRRLNNTWENYWEKVLKDRKNFEVRIGRQRMDFFETLGSLDPAAHAAAIVKFDELQSNQMKSFEDTQKQKMADFFAAIANQLRDLSVDQEKLRQDFLTQAMDAWQTQKTAAQ